ncbi:hypothetical protein [Aneurinibacillus uraniidurans]|uniref:hypothetical protein n=1 Tax=Aneurinibacillus uraniidurans TaxID=2966586 RepID=UPI00234A62E4|nr:hypothetical protein [Aneurinibacillus sp. B1]WCN38741.1 hypothetical protein PO771_04875 [Aneurinibacillus sp. B1]
MKRILKVTVLLFSLCIVSLSLLLYAKKESIAVAGGAFPYASAMYQLHIEKKSMAKIQAKDGTISYVVHRGNYQPFIEKMNEEGCTLSSQKGRDLYFSNGPNALEHYYVRYLTGKYDIIYTSSYPVDYFS